MGHPDFPLDSNSPLVADASLWINLAATDCAGRILESLGRPVLITDVAMDELERGRLKGRVSADVVNSLLASGHVKVMTLPAAAQATYADLVVGEAAETLDDGEAATLAL